jgi:ribonuclease J
MVKIHAIGGYSEVGKNMTAVEVGEDAFIFDEGFFLPAIVKMQENDKGKDEYAYSEKKLRDIEAIPNDLTLDKIRYKVRAQFIGHAHLDHVGAVPFISDRYNAPIYGTPFTTAVLDSLLKDNDIYLHNKVKSIHPNTSFYVQGKNKKYLVEFVNMTHSTPQTSLIVLHTEKGAIVYANDFKLDDNPVLGLKPNYDQIRKIAKGGVLALIVDSLYSGSDKKTPSEKIARSLLEEVMFTIDNRNSGIVVTTFSSHIARLKSIVEFGQKMNRQILFLGRSLNKYCTAAQSTGISPFLKNIQFSKYRRQLEKSLQKVERKRQDYLVVCTGHQGEPGSILERISRGQMPLKINEEDNIIFSSSVIPAEINIKNFTEMEDKLKKRKARIFRDVHVSGHGGREDLRELVKLLNPQHIIPSHGGHDKTAPMMELSAELGYKSGKQCHLLSDGDVLEL